jgi:hypothetical protein
LELVEQQDLEPKTTDQEILDKTHQLFVLQHLAVVEVLDGRTQHYLLEEQTAVVQEQDSLHPTADQTQALVQDLDCSQHLHLVVLEIEEGSQYLNGLLVAVEQEDMALTQLAV